MALHYMYTIQMWATLRREVQCIIDLPVGSVVKLLILRVPMASYGTQLLAPVDGRINSSPSSRPRRLDSTTWP